MPSSAADSTRSRHTRPDAARRRRSRAAAALGMALAGSCLAAPALVASAAPAAPAAAAPRPGLIGSPIVIANQGQFDGYDVATTAAGTTFVGWISAGTSSTGRLVHLCSIPAGQLTCAGGVHTIDSLGPSSAEGLRVLAAPSGAVTLVWFHDTSPGSVNGPRGGRIAEATVGAGGSLNAAVDVGDAPSFGSMVAAGIGPDHTIWTVDAASAGGGPLGVRDGTGPDVKVAIPWPYVGSVSLAFAGPTPILGAAQAGQVIKPVFAASRTATYAWTRFAPVAGTWSVQVDTGLTATSSGVRLVTSVNNSTYHPVVAAWTGTAFGRPVLIGDTNNCAPTSHDTATDASGRLVDVSIECNQISVANLEKTTHAAIVRFGTRGITAGGTPQIATTRSGRAIVAWTVEAPSTPTDRLYLAAVQLAGVPH